MSNTSPSGRPVAAWVQEGMLRLFDLDAGAPIPSFWVGEVGVLLATWRLDPSAVALSELRALVDANRDHPANEPFLGASGTLLAAVWLAALTEDPAWRSLADAHAEAVRARWQPDPRVGCSLWIQDLYGEIVDQLGAAHGLAGNVYALLRVRRDPARAQGAHGLQAVRHRLHAREPDGLVHGVVRRRSRGALHLRTVPRHPGRGRLIMAKAQYIRPIDFKHGRVDMNHGAGGRASAQLIDEVFVRDIADEQRYAFRQKL
mgnify:CR=1 FL=1